MWLRRANVTTRLLGSLTKSHGNGATTRLGEEVELFPVKPLNAGVALSWETQLVGSCIDDIDDSVGAIGKIIRLRRLIDEANVEHIHFAGSCVRRSSRAGNRPQQTDRPVLSLALPCRCVRSMQRH